MEKQFRKLLLILLCFASIPAMAQQRTVTGQVTDDTGMPIPGVSVYIQDTSIGTVTDLDGEFTLNAPDNPDAILIFSSIGFAQQELRLGNQNSFTLVLEEDMEGLDEVVLVGYGTQRRANLTGAVSTIDTEVLSPDRSQMLHGDCKGLVQVLPSLHLVDK